MNKKIAVIGGGIIGSWTALHLAEAGVATTLFEQFPLPHTRGSSHGLSRAFRFLGELELDRLYYSLDRWQDLEKITGEAVFVKTGLLNFGPPGDADLDLYMNVLRESGWPCEWLDNQAIAIRYPMLNYPDNWGAAFDPNGGILIAHRCLTAVQALFLNMGGRLVNGQVVQLECHDVSSVQMEVRSGISREIQKLTFDRVVICAGPWTRRLVPRLQSFLKCLLTPVTYWRDRSDKYSAFNGSPIIFNARLTDVYGLPSCEYPGQVKMLFHGGPETDPELRDQLPLGSYIDKVRRYVQEHLPFLDHSAPSISETCMYTMTPDGFPVIDRLSDNLIVGCGFSGSGFKHSPATGRMLAALTLHKEDGLPQGFRRDRYLLNRFYIEK